MWETSVINSNYEVNELGQVRNKQTGVRNGCISLVTRGKRHTAGGFVWRDLVEGSTTIENLKDK